MTKPGRASAFNITQDDYVPRSSQDRALTAFAQLAPLRLNVKRALISLIDSSKQFILAEATQSISLQVDGRHGTEDQMLFGNVVISRDTCPHGLDTTCTLKDEEGNDRTIDGLLISDLRLDDKYGSSWLVREKNIVFFASVPIVTKSGYKIGTYSVLSNERRDHTTLAELNFFKMLPRPCSNTWISPRDGSIVSARRKRFVVLLNSLSSR